ncbi:MAG: MliC family protein [Hyphomonadaceae bacterium]
MRKILVLAAAAALAACAQNAKPEAARKKTALPPPSAAALQEPVTWAFACADGTVLKATFSTAPDAVRLVFADGRALTLPQAISASGARYADGANEFWNKGEEATLTLAPAPPQRCHASN